MRFILGAKPGDHALLFHNFNVAVEQGTATTFSSIDPKDPNLVIVDPGSRTKV
jgi:hypothetical protein